MRGHRGIHVHAVNAPSHLGPSPLKSRRSDAFACGSNIAVDGRMGSLACAMRRSLLLAVALMLVGCVHEYEQAQYNGEDRVLYFDGVDDSPLVLPVRATVEFGDDHAVRVRHPRSGANNCVNATGLGCGGPPPADTLEFVKAWCVGITCTGLGGAQDPVSGGVYVGAVAATPGSGHLRVRVRVATTGEELEDGYPVRFVQAEAEAGDAGTID